jgi:hypothetical protein
MQTQVFKFLVSYDVLTQQISILQEIITGKNTTQPANTLTGSADNANLTPVKQATNNPQSVPNVPTPALSNTAPQPTTPQNTPNSPVPSTPSAVLTV